MSISAPPRIFTVMPAYGQVNCAQTTTTLLALQRLLIANDWSGGFGTLSFPDICELRNIFATIWYDTIGTSHMLFIDSDMAFNPQLIADMMAQDKPLVGVLCPKRKIPVEFAGRAKAGPSNIINGFMEVDGIGGAIMLIRRDCMDAILAADPGLIDTKSVKNHAAKEMLGMHNINRMLRVFDKITVDGEVFSEDLSFSKRWRDTGGEIWANITYEITHVGSHEFKGCLWEHIKGSVTATDGVVKAVSAPAEPLPMELQAEMMQAAE